MTLSANQHFSSNFSTMLPSHNPNTRSSSPYLNQLLMDFNRELSYDYSNNTFNPKISLRSYCFSQKLEPSDSNPNRTGSDIKYFNTPSSVSSTQNSLSNQHIFTPKQEYPDSHSQYSSPFSNTSINNANVGGSFSGTSNFPDLVLASQHSSDNSNSNVSFTSKGYNGSSTPSSYPTTGASTPTNETSPITSPSDSDATFGSVGGNAGKKKKRCNLPKKTTKILIDWLNDNLNNPYPNSKEKFELIMKTGLTNQQLSNWFINARRRKINNLRENQVKNGQGIMN